MVFLWLNKIDGVPYGQPSYVCLCDKGGFNVDAGVPVDYALTCTPAGQALIDYRNYFDIPIISEYLSTAYPKSK